MKNQCNSLRHALIDFDARVSRNSTARELAPALLERTFFYRGATDGGNNSCAIITPTLAYLPDQIGGGNKSALPRTARDWYRLALFT